MPQPAASARYRLSARLGLALVACATALPLPADGSLLIQLQVMPAGAFRPQDGREMPVDAWRIDAEAAAQVIERWRQRRTPLVIDYEHQTLHKETNGQPAPAAAWIRDLAWREDGLWATVELTAQARDQIRSRQYLYFSPVFTFERGTGRVRELLMGALTNTPAIDGMAPLSDDQVARAAASLGAHFDDLTETRVTPLLKALLARLSLPDTTTEEQAIAALNALPPAGAADLAPVRAALGLPADAGVDAVVAAATAARKPDPAQYVPVAALTQVQTELAALSAKLREGELEQVMATALADGLVLPGEQEAWARDLGRTDLAALTRYLKTVKPIAALTRTQTDGKAPGAGAGAGGDDAHGLTADELAVCAQMGLTPKAFAAAKA